MSVPQVIVTLSPQGELCAELPINGGRRRVAMRQSEVADTLLRILQSQLVSRIALGEDGSPTQAQVTHWERHGTFADDRCAFCIAEGRTHGRQVRASRRSEILAEHDGLIVRRVAAGKRAKRPARQVAAIGKSAKELGL